MGLLVRGLPCHVFLLKKLLSAQSRGYVGWSSGCSLCVCLSVCVLIQRSARRSMQRPSWATLRSLSSSSSLEAVRVLIRHSADVNARDKNWQTPLHVAAANNALRCAEVIIPLLSSVNVSDRGGRTALHHAALNGHTESRDGKSPLHMTAVHGRFTRSQTLIQNGGEIDSVDKDGNTPLHIAARYGHELLINTLITSGADCTRRGVHGMFPLHLAALNAHADCCRKLLSSAAVLRLDRTALSAVHVFSCLCMAGIMHSHLTFSAPHPLPVALTPVFLSSSSSSSSPCLYLSLCDGCCCCCVLSGLPLVSLRCPRQVGGFQIDTPDSLGRTCLHAAAAGGNVECVKLLLSSGGDHNRRDTCGRTPLHYAASSRHYQCLETLVTCGTAINATDQWGRSALHYAAASDLDRRRRVALEPESEGVQAEREKEAALCLEFLLQSGATHSLKDKQSYSPVHYAAAYGHRQCLELLLDRDNSHQDDPESLNTRSPLHLAAYHGHAQALEVLLQGEREVDQGDEVGRTPLALAALRGHSDCVHTLLSQGASPRTTDTQYGRTPVHLAVMNGHTTCVRLLLDESDSADMVDAADSQGQTPLMLAVAGGHVDAVSLLLEREANVNVPDNHGLTALHLGVLCGQEECIQCLLEQEASVLLGDSRGRTVIHLAAARGHASWLSELLSIACSEPPSLPPLRDHSGYTPLHWACYYGYDGCVEVLLEQKGCRCIDGNPFTPLHCAVVNDHEPCATLLLEAMGSDIAGCKDAKDRTPLHAAAFSGHVDCVQLLLSHDAPVDAVDQSGRTALMMAAEKGRVEALEVLLTSASANLSLIDKDGNTALHLACSNGKEDCVLLILEKLPDSALINATNAALQTPLHLAARSGLKQAVQELLSRGANVQTVDENGLTPALACAPSREVADCLALILATMMPFCSPCSSGAPSPGSLLRQLPHKVVKGPGPGPRGPRSPRNPSRPSSEGTTENDSEDSETF
ncbi:hypothetical protein PAMP_003510 [Pampus punctatissimus]